MNIKLKYLFIYILLASTKLAYATDNPTVTTGINDKATITTTDANKITETIYDDRLVQLYSALGALHFLTNICFEQTMQFRQKAEALAQSEKLNDLRKKNLFGAFNDSYNAFSTNYRSCTQSARKAYNIYKTDALAISASLITQLGQTQNQD